MKFNWATFGENLLQDALLGGALAAEIFVKNPNSQNEAARMLSAANTLVQTIIGQIHGTAPTAPATAPTTSVTSTPSAVPLA